MFVQNVPVCRFKTSPCMPAPRAHVENTCARDAGTHRVVSNLYTGVFQRVTAHTTTTPQPQPQPQP